MLYIDCVLHFLAFYDGWFVELLTATEFFYDAGLFEFTFEFFEGLFDVVALFYRYNDHFVLFLLWNLRLLWINYRLGSGD